MIKMIAIIKRKPGITHDAFKAYYEANHVVMAQQHMGHLMLSYQRVYLPAMQALSEGSGDASDAAENLGPDVVTQIVLPDRAALEAWGQIFNAPGTNELFTEDEKEFIDRDASFWGIGDVVVTDLEAVRSAKATHHSLA